MKTISPELAAHLASGHLTIATLWKVERVDGITLCFTNHDQDITVDDETYVSSSGYDPSDIQTLCTLEVDNLDLDGAMISPAITEADLKAGLWDYAKITVTLVNWADLTQGGLVQRVGRLGRVTILRGRYKAELRGLMYAYQTIIGEKTSATCRATLGDARCGVDLLSLTVTGTVVAIDVDGVTISDATRTEDAHQSGTAYFAGGVLTWTSGANEGMSMEIRDASTGKLVLGKPMPYAVAAGDKYELTSGCPKLLQDCIGTYGNVVNFRGEPHLRGNDILFQQGRRT